MPSAEEFLTQGQPAVAPMSAEDFLTSGPPQKPSLLGQMGANFANAGQAANDLFSGNYQDIGHTTPTPKTEALNDKMFPPGYQGGLMEAFHNVGNTVPSDWSGALLEKMGETPEGKALSIITGAHPLYNAASTAVGNYVNPAISEATGIHPDNLALLETGASIFGLKKAAQTPDPLISAGRSILSNMGDGSGTQFPEIPSLADIKGKASELYKASDQSGGALHAEAFAKAIDEANKTSGFQSEEGKSFAGDNAVTKTLNDLETLRGKPLSLKGAGEIDDNLGDRISAAYRSGDNDVASKLMQIRDTLRGTYKNAGEADMINPQGFQQWRQGDQLWSAYRSMQDMQRIIDNAYMTDNPATAMKTGFRTLSKAVNKNPQGYTPEEVSAINSAAKTGIATGAMKILGSRLISGLTGAIAGSGGGPIGTIGGAVAGEMAGFPMRSIANAMQEGRATKPMNLVAQRPDVQALMNPNSQLPTPAIAAPLSTNPVPALMGGALGQAQQKLRPSGAGVPAAGQVGLPQQPALPASPGPQTNAAPDISGFSEAESGNNPNAKSQTSTASGLYGFTNRTWANMIMRYGKQTGLTLQDKSDPRAQAMMASLLAKDNIKELTPILGRMPTKGELYMAHFLGAKGAATLLNADPQKEAIMLFPRQVFDANRSVFFNGKQPRTVGEVRQLLNDKVA